MKDLPCYSLLGVQVNPLALPDLSCLIDNSIRTRKRCIIASQNLHSIYVYHHDPRMQDLQARAYKRIDSMPLIILGRLLGYPLNCEHRITWVDWMRPLMAEAEQRGWRIFYVGSKPGVSEKGAAILRADFPRLQIAATDGYFDMRPESAENLRKLEAIRAFRTDVLIVGMGMPRQEHWILDNLDKLYVSAILTSGAAMDYVAGVVSTPPRWMGRWGLEWLYRLAGDPRRLWRRYLIEPWYLARLLARDFLRLRVRNS